MMWYIVILMFASTGTAVTVAQTSEADCKQNVVYAKAQERVITAFCITGAKQ